MKPVSKRQIVAMHPDVAGSDSNFCNMAKSILYLTICLLTISGCKKDKSPTLTVPELTTTAITSITANAATGGGTITSNGGETITISGVCWSTTNQNPTISDDTTKGNTGSGTFTTILSNLNSSSTYYVRAYATNRIGTGYGNVVTFNTGNATPVATSVNITGTPKGNELLTGNYIYSDSENDPESGSTFQWYVANDGTGADETPIEGATEQTFRVRDEQEGKYIRFGVMPKAGSGNQNGVEVKSNFTTAVGEATTVTFTYEGADVTYGIIIGPSGKKWLDRNLGAGRVAESEADYQAYGDMFQWGRIADGHQKITRTSGADEDAAGATGTTSTTSNVDVPPVNQFITNTSLIGDWRNPQNNNLWQGVNGINNPCPIGWRLATADEWTAEGITNITDGFNKLKLTYSGFRDLVDGGIYLSSSDGRYWTSSIISSESTLSVQVYLDPSTFATFSNNRANGYPCRCIKD